MKRIIAAILVSVTLILIVFAVGYTRIESTDRVRGVRVSRRTAVERLAYTGTVEYSDSSNVSANGSGAVQSVFFKNGDIVEAGDVIMTAFETYADISGSELYSVLTSGSFDGAAELLGSGGSAAVYTAPADGVLTGLDVESGGFFVKGQTLFRVSGKKSFQVQLAVAEKDIAKVRKGQGVTVDCRALPDMLHGSVSSVGDSASQTGSAGAKITSVKVGVALDGSCDGLKPGYTADCSIVTATKQNTLLAPYSSVLHDETGKAFVYASNGSSAEKRFVAQGEEYSNGIEILDGIDDGDVIVYDAAKVNDPSKTVVSEVTVYAK